MKESTNTKKKISMKDAHAKDLENVLKSSPPPSTTVQKSGEIEKVLA